MPDVTRQAQRKEPESRAHCRPPQAEEFGAMLKDEVARWGKVVRDKGIKETN
jgi:hypothetical protein